MSKGEQTRQRIIEQAAGLFNQRGYSGAAINDVMAVTGLQKGGIYRHFQSKEELALAAFDFAVQQSTRLLDQAMQATTDPIDQLLAFITAFYTRAQHPSVPGGCPVFNTLIDSDDGDPALCARARAVVTRWEQLISSSVTCGIAEGSVRADADPQAVATLLIGTLEGAILLARVHANPRYLQHAVNLLTSYVQRDLAI